MEIMMKTILILFAVMLLTTSCGEETNGQMVYDDMNSQMTILPICGNMDKVYYAGYNRDDMIDINDENEDPIIEIGDNRSIFDIVTVGNSVFYNSVGFKDYKIYEMNGDGGISERFTIDQEMALWSGKDFIFPEEDNIYYFAYGDRSLYCFCNGETKAVLNSVTAVCVGTDNIYYGDSNGNICVSDKQFSDVKILWNKSQLETDGGETAEFYKITNSGDTIIKDISVIGDTIRFIYGNINSMGSGILIELNKDGEYYVNMDIRVESYQYYQDSIIFSGYSLDEDDNVHGLFSKKNDDVKLLKQLPVNRIWGTYIYGNKMYYGYNDYSNSMIILESIEL